MDDNIVLLDTEGIKQRYAAITSFFTDECKLYMAFVPLDRPKTKNSIVTEFRRYYREDGKTYYYSLKTPEEVMKVIRAYHEHLDRLPYPEILEDNEDEGEDGKCGKVLKRSLG